MLIAAASNGHLATVKLVLKRGADVNLRNSRGCTALHLALKYGYTDVAQCLIASNAEVRAPCARRREICRAWTGEGRGAPTEGVRTGDGNGSDGDGNGAAETVRVI